jgi:hypothetical protein
VDRRAERNRARCHPASFYLSESGNRALADYQHGPAAVGEVLKLGLWAGTTAAGLSDYGVFSRGPAGHPDRDAGGE